MIKYFCDICEEEITERNQVSSETCKTRLGTEVVYRTKSKKIGVEVITFLDGVSNAGNFCRYCVIDTINTMDDRPRAE